MLCSLPSYRLKFDSWWYDLQPSFWTREIFLWEKEIIVINLILIGLHILKKYEAAPFPNFEVFFLKILVCFVSFTRIFRTLYALHFLSDWAVFLFSSVFLFLIFSKSKVCCLRCTRKSKFVIYQHGIFSKPHRRCGKFVSEFSGNLMNNTLVKILLSMEKLFSKKY